MFPPSNSGSTGYQGNDSTTMRISDWSGRELALHARRPPRRASSAFPGFGLALDAADLEKGKALHCCPAFGSQHSERLREATEVTLPAIVRATPWGRVFFF